ncbi:MAG: hypothetical protein UV71_C0006G0023 [Microgenomates group bacterium GW2011_GWC1_43_13]|uniref:Uncharacterized protein n=3 Tax=Candidatus Woeseibacteriota TaxID=1752722 RepID=A0A837IJX4_9BACT|nr:MAG: hypothetical protein UV71_C0006G0023 [Microgenomates group bacterium GW2011_GWC1_43_13]KKT32558.1 MAG: hypothetical protein UW20_C0012G0004 [Candidatus Woesebacteria bacterium GW2011_GWB1_44_11]KKT54293.1 MAG: hypothetical protein UW47_C0007G0013 [Candidatus Woesebacteria bacterium GW2011_GWA1_44_23]OGM76674.1 MAG: hypothetical protein A2208_03135 [Candidatus Woesebacteria bacterium RIFOXYA1_FULL_43_16]OGM83169.1 MAG: hypothetical protein A2394_02690 [Candidatus Woesebacteria bacterium 
MPKYFRFLLPAIGILLLFIGISSFFLTKFSNACQIEITSEQGAPKIKVKDRELWNSFLSAFAPCQDGKYQVYDLKSTPLRVRKVTYVFVNRDTNLISFENFQSKTVLFKWKSDVDPENDSAKLSIYLFGTGTTNFEERLLSAIYLTTKALFMQNMQDPLPLDPSNFNSLDKIGLTYDK